MPLGRLSARIDAANERHHLWCNNGTWWVHYTLNFDFRTRRVRRSLKTPSLAEAIRKRDDLFERLASEGEWVPDRDPELPMPVSPASTPGWTRTTDPGIRNPMLYPTELRARKEPCLGRGGSRHWILTTLGVRGHFTHWPWWGGPVPGRAR